MLTTYEQGTEEINSSVEASFNLAKESCYRVYGKEKHSTLAGGVHATSIDAVKNILKLLIPKMLEGQVIWEIGVGYPRLAFILSAVSKRAVLCNDIGE